MIGIYKITSPTNKVYIGQSVDVNNRFIQHKKDSKRKKSRLYSSMRKHGFDNHFFEIIEICSINLLNERERYWQEFYNVLGVNGLNLRYTATDDKSGYLSDETIAKLKNKDVTYMYGNDFRTGIKHTEQIKNQIKNTLKDNAKKDNYKNAMTGKFGNLNPFYGRKHTEETKNKISLNHKNNDALCSRIKIYNEIRKNKIIDISNGFIFDSIAEAAITYNINKSTLKAYLSGRLKNKTNLIKL
jgi:group I intron endonuclease